jgi:hypothetical protein
MKTVVRRRELRHAYPEFLPDPNPSYRNPLREKLERRDMLRRRQESIFYESPFLTKKFSDNFFPFSSPVPESLANVLLSTFLF